MGSAKGAARTRGTRSTNLKFPRGKRRPPTTDVVRMRKCGSRRASWSRRGRHSRAHYGEGRKVIKPPVGEGKLSIEAPKGELRYYVVSDGSTQPYRVRMRPPSFAEFAGARPDGARGIDCGCGGGDSDVGYCIGEVTGRGRAWPDPYGARLMVKLLRRIPGGSAGRGCG